MALRETRQGTSQATIEHVSSFDEGLPPIQELTAQQSREFFEDKVHELLGISADTFIERWHAGRYRDILDDPDHSDIMYLTLLGNIGRNI